MPEKKRSTSHIYHHETFREGGQAFTLDLKPDSENHTLIERRRVNPRERTGNPPAEIDAGNIPHGIAPEKETVLTKGENPDASHKSQ